MLAQFRHNSSRRIHVRQSQMLSRAQQAWRPTYGSPPACDACQQLGLRCAKARLAAATTSLGVSLLKLAELSQVAVDIGYAVD